MDVTDYGCESILRGRGLDDLMGLFGITKKDETGPEKPNRREYVRVYYPLNFLKGVMPVVIIHARSYRVMDLSELGIRIENPNLNLIPNSKLSLILQFPDGSTLSLVGRVVRRAGRQVSLRLDGGIPYSRIVSEQLRLRKLVIGGSISYSDKD